MKTRSTVALLLAAAAALFASACDDSVSIIDPTPAFVRGNGHVVEQSRAVDGFTSVDHAGVGQLYIQQGAREELFIRAEENLLDYLRTETHAGQLMIWKEGVTLLNTRPIEYHLTVVDLESLALTGAGLIHGSDLDTGPLALSLTGVGNIELMNLSAAGLDIKSSGVGEVILSGSAQEQTIRLRSMARYNGRDLASATADVLIGDGGSATVRVQDHLSATIDGSGSVFYIGDPIVDSSGNGSGNVVKIGG